MTREGEESAATSWRFMVKFRDSNRFCSFFCSFFLGFVFLFAFYGCTYKEESLPWFCRWNIKKVGLANGVGRVSLAYSSGKPSVLVGIGTEWEQKPASLLEAAGMRNCRLLQQKPVKGSWVFSALSTGGVRAGQQDTTGLIFNAGLWTRCVNTIFEMELLKYSFPKLKNGHLFSDKQWFLLNKSVETGKEVNLNKILKNNISQRDKQ